MERGLKSMTAFRVVNSGFQRSRNETELGGDWAATSHRLFVGQCKEILKCCRERVSSWGFFFSYFFAPLCIEDKRLD